MRPTLCALLIIALMLCAAAARDRSVRRHSTESFVRSSSSETAFQSPTTYNNPDVDMEATQIQALIVATNDMPIAAWTQANLVDACRTPNSPTGILSCTDNGFPTVLALSLPDSINGALSPHIGALTELTTLNLSLSLSFTSSVPVAWRTLTHLTTLYLGSGIYMVGQIPEEWSEMTSLTSLTINLDSTNILTSIPTWTGNLTTLRLQRANLENRMLPDFLFTSPSLTTLSLDDIRYGGNIPTELANNSIIQNFYLTSSAVGATRISIPSDLSGMTSLKSFTLSKIAVESTFPSVWPSGLVSLELVSLPYMTGTIPQSLFDSPSLTSITLDYLEQVEGSFPGPSDPTLSNMESIQVAHLTGLTGTTSFAWFWIPSLTTFKVTQASSLQPHELGPLPTIASGLCKIKILDLSDSQLSGSLPPALFSICPDLETATFYDNLLTGPIPNDWSKSNGRVTAFYASNNRLTGSIPAGMKFSNSGVLELDFYDNRLTGPLPADLFTVAWSYIDLELNDMDVCAGNVTISPNLDTCYIGQRSTANFCPCASIWSGAGCQVSSCSTPSTGFPPLADFPPYTPATPLPPAFHPPPVAVPIEEPVSTPSISPSPSTTPNVPNIPGSPTLTPNAPTPTAATTPNVPIAAASSVTVSVALLVSAAFIALLM